MDKEKLLAFIRKLKKDNPTLEHHAAYIHIIWQIEQMAQEELDEMFI